MKIKQIALAAILPLLISCATFDIVRTSKNSRTITVKTLIATKSQLVIHLMYKAVYLECRNLVITEIIEGSHATAICTDEGHMFDTRKTVGGTNKR